MLSEIEKILDNAGITRNLWIGGSPIVSRVQSLVNERDIAKSQIEKLRVALADAIRSPMGVIPESAENYLSQKDLDQAEDRRVLRSQRSITESIEFQRKHGE